MWFFIDLKIAIIAFKAKIKKVHLIDPNLKPSWLFDPSLLIIKKHFIYLGLADTKFKKFRLCFGHPLFWRIYRCLPRTFFWINTSARVSATDFTQNLNIFIHFIRFLGSSCRETLSGSLDWWCVASSSTSSLACRLTLT